MKRMAIWMVLSLLCTTVTFAQNKVITVSGQVVEEDTKEPVEMATVQLLALPDSAQAAGVVTQKLGRFTLPKVKAGKYLLRISYIGFITQNIPLQLTDKVPSKNVGAIVLKSDAVMLSEAVITAEAPPVTIKADTTEYNASAYRVAEGAMLEELVKKIPGAEVDKDGKITLNGKEIKKIMVDGKEFFSDDPKMSMKNLPANMIEKVKAYDKKSDMSRITGIDDGEEEAVLDLTVKKGMKKGWIGDVLAGYGNKSRYDAKAMISRFKDDASLSVIGSANNTNNTGFSEFGDAGQGMGGGNAGAGVTAAKSAGINFAKESKKIQIGGNVQYGFSDNDAIRKSSTEAIGASEYEKSESFSSRGRHDVRADFRLEWRPDTMTTIIFRPNASYSKTNSESHSTSQLSKDKEGNILIYDKKSNSNSKSNNYTINGNLMIFRRLNNKGRNLYAGARFGYSDGGTNGFSYSDGLFFNPDSVGNTDRYSNRISDSRNWSVSASYTEPLFKNHFLQLRYEFAHRRQLAQSLVYDSIIDFPNYLERGYSDSLSSRVENFYDTHTADLSFRGVQTKMMYSVGASLIPQASLSKTTIGPNSKKPENNQSVLNWAPSVMFRYMFTKQHVLMFRYRGRSSAPDVEDLQQVIDVVSDPMNLRYGNPNLKPSFNNNFTLYYNKFTPESMRSYSLNLSYSNTLNAISNRVVYFGNGAKAYYKENVDGNWNARGNFSFNTPFKNKKFTLSANTRTSYSDAVSFTKVGGSSEQELSTTHNFVFGQQLTGNYRCDLFDVSLNGSANYNLVRNSKLSEGNRETYDYNMGGSTNINLPWQIYLSSDVDCRFKVGYTGGFDDNNVIWNAQISKNFLKNNSATIRFKIYDILKQQTNLSRSSSSEQITDTEYNTLGSYFMVHFVYRFNTLGGNAPSRRGSGFEGGRGRSSGGGGRPHRF